MIGRFNNEQPAQCTVVGLPRTKAIISIENVVAVATIKERLDLNLIAKLLPEARYEPKTFPGLILKMKRPKATALVFSSGRVVFAGAKSEEQAYRAVKLLAQRLRESGVEIKDDPEATIQNIVGTASLGGRVKIEDAARTLRRSLYEPEQFPGLLYEMDEPHISFLIFSSGRVVCTGAKKEDDIYRAITTLQNTLEEKGLMTY